MAPELRVRAYEPYFARAERLYGIPKGLLRAQAIVESGGNPNAVSPVGAVGLMQFMEPTARQYGLAGETHGGRKFDWRTNPEKAIDAAGRYMRDLGTQFQGDWLKAVAAYNAGPGRVEKGSLPRETRDYVSRVRSFWEGATAYRDTAEGKAEGLGEKCELVWWDLSTWNELERCVKGAVQPVVVLLVIGGILSVYGLRGLVMGRAR